MAFPVFPVNNSSNLVIFLTIFNFFKDMLALSMKSGELAIYLNFSTLSKIHQLKDISLVLFEGLFNGNCVFWVIRYNTSKTEHFQVINSYNSTLGTPKRPV